MISQRRLRTAPELLPQFHRQPRLLAAGTLWSEMDSPLIEDRVEAGLLAIRRSPIQGEVFVTKTALDKPQRAKRD